MTQVEILGYTKRRVLLRHKVSKGNWEVLARIHNGGPNGHKKKATIEYWEKVKAELEKIERR